MAAPDPAAEGVPARRDLLLLLVDTAACDTVVRLGGDEFAVLLDGVTADEVHQIADRVRAALARSYALPDRPVPVPMTCSVGVALVEGEVDRLPDLLRRADAAMYRENRPDTGLRAG